MTKIKMFCNNAIICLENAKNEIIVYPYNIRGNDIRKIQLASCIKGKWVTSHPDVEDTLCMIKQLESEAYYEILETFDIFDTKNKEPLYQVKELKKQWLKDIGFPPIDEFLIHSIETYSRDIMLKHLSISGIEYSIARNLINSNIQIVAQLMKLSDEELLKIRGIGSKKLFEIKEFMKKIK